MRSALKVLHVIPSVSPRDGGPSKAVALMERTLCAAGVKVTTLTTDHDFELVGEHGVFSHIPARRIYVHKWTDVYKAAPAAIPRLIEAIQNHDIVHIHALFSFTSTVAAWIARAYNVPYIVKPHGTLNTYGLGNRRRRLKLLSMKLIENEILRHASAVHYTSEAELKEAECLGVPINPIIIPLAVEMEDCDPDEDLKLRYKLPAHRKVVLFLSRLDPKKNLEGLIDAFAISDTLRNKATLVIAGTGEPKYSAALKHRAVAAGLAATTIWLGHVEGKKKAAAFAAADVFVLPSYSESFGIAAAEALVAGKPCILGEGVAIAKEIEQAGAGFALIPEPGAISRSLEHLLNADVLRNEMGIQARKFALNQYSVETMVRRLIALYEQTIEERPGRQS